MLSLFKDQEVPVAKDLALKRSREILVSYLNKGVIPSWETYFQDLPTLNEASDLVCIQDLFLKLTTWSFLDKIIQTEATEFFFHSPEKSQYLTLDGKKTSFEVPLSKQDWQLWLEIISIYFKQNWNVKNPFVSFHGKFGEKSFRFSLIHEATSPNGLSKLVLRTLSQTPHDLNSFGDTTKLQDLIKGKKNILIAGSTGSGKTSLLTSLITLINEDEHLVILEDTYEIMCTHSHQTRFLAGDTNETSLKSYLAYSLRLSPDRIILGEMRSHEVIPFLMAMNTGHKGLMGTLHASSAVDALHRIALLFSLYSNETNLNFEKVMELICRNMEYVVFVENKKVKEIIKILGCDKGVAFFETMPGFKESKNNFNLF